MSEAASIVSEVMTQAAEMYSEMAARVPAEGVAEVPEAKGEVKPPKAETYCPTLTQDKCTAPCMWSVTGCMEIDVVIMKRNPLPEESDSTPVRSWKLAVLAIAGLITGVIFGVAFSQCRQKEINNDVFVPLDR